GQPVERLRFRLVVMNMRVAGVPALVGHADPAPQRQVDVERAAGGYVDPEPQRLVLCAALDQDVGLAALQLHGERAVRVEELLPGPDLSQGRRGRRQQAGRDRKSTRLNSSHLGISYAVFCLKKKTRCRASVRSPPRTPPASF